MSGKPWDEKIGDWEAQIRRGQFAGVRADIERLISTEVPREKTAAVASIAYRSGLSYWAIRLLGPVIRPEVLTDDKATPSEIMAYAASLFRIGVMQEGFDLLRSLSGKSHPEILLHEAFGRYREWDYVTGVPLLKRFLRLIPESDYRSLVGKVNLAAGLIFLQEYDDAEKILAFLLQETGQKNYELLYGNSLELLAQVRIFQKKHDEARDILIQSDKRIDSSQGTYSFFVRKWMVLNEWLRNETPTKEALLALRELREEALRIGHWETLRDCDYYEALRTGDASLVARLTFGTPHLGFRRRLLDIFGESARRKGTYLWMHGEAGMSAEPATIDPARTLWSAESAGGELSPVLRRMWLSLCRDFYRPIPLGEFFSEIFPGEYFDAHSSPARVSINVQRLRAWWEKQGLPLDIEVKNKAFRITASAPCALKLYRPAEPLSNHELYLRDLKLKMASRSFSISEAVAVLNVSLSTVQRALQLGMKKRMITKTGRGRGCRYRFGGAKGARV